MAKQTYRGLAFPFGKSSSSFPAEASDHELVRQSLKQIILTAPGERVMRPEFGCNAYAFVFENNDTLLAELIRPEVTGAIGRFEPRVIVRSVDVARSGSEVVIRIAYALRLTGEQSLVDVSVPTNTSEG